MNENLITNGELREYAPDLDLSSYTETTISGMIARASKRAVEYCDVAGFYKKAVTAERDRLNVAPNGDLVISFERRPVQDGDVSALRLVSVDINHALTLTNNGSNIYFIPKEKTYMVYPSNYLISHGTGLVTYEFRDLFYELDYVGGYATDVADIPADLKEATTLMVRSMVGKKLNAAGATNFTQGSVSVGFGSDGRDQLVKEAEAILDSGGYARKVI